MNELEILRLKARGYCCSQIMVCLVLDLLDMDLLDPANQNLVNFARGLCMGSGLETGSCGILTAGISILAMYSPRDGDLRAAMTEAYVDFFTKRTAGRTGCKEIAGNHYPNFNPDTCGSLLVSAHERLLGILSENGIDPSYMDPSDMDHD